MNAHRLAARLRKADAIAGLLAAAGVRPEDAEYFPTAGRNAAAAHAGVTPPSDDTWDIVVAQLINIERTVVQL